MKNIKFRAWDEKYKTMEYIDDLYWFEENGVHSGDGEGIYNNYKLMQYTGFKDKNDKYVYEGDIIKNKKGTISRAIYHNYCFCLDSGFLKLPLFKFNSYDELEVIGNVYEDQDLLK